MECGRLLPETTGQAAQTLTRLKELTTVALGSPGIELLMAGD